MRLHFAALAEQLQQPDAVDRSRGAGEATTSLPLPSIPGLCAYAVLVPDQQEPEELIIDDAPPPAGSNARPA